MGATLKPSEHDLLILERDLKLSIPSEYRKILLRYGIITISENVHKINSKVGIEYFLNVGGDKNSILYNYNTFQSRIPSEFLPIADAVGGNLILIETKTQSVYFWDHELEEDRGHEAGYEALVKLNDSFDDFLKALVTPEPVSGGGATVTFIDPEFAKKMKALGYMK